MTGEPFAFAGLWRSWRDPEGESVLSCTIMTTEPNELLRSIREPTPTILPTRQEFLWLDDEVLAPYPAELMDAYLVSILVNRPSNDRPEVAEPTGRGLCDVSLPTQVFSGELPRILPLLGDRCGTNRG